MTSDIFDNLPVSSLDNFHKFRESTYNFLYLCKACARTFDSEKSMETCKFCGNPVTELRSVKRNREALKDGFRKNIRYRYYCPTCEKNFVTTEKLALCNTCRTDYLHVYTWDLLRKRDRLYIKLNKALKTVFENKANKAQTKITIKRPVFSVNFSRPKEEVPTF